MIGLSPAGSALVASASGFGLGTALSQQVKDETDEEKRRRLQQMQAQRAGLSPAGRAIAYAGTSLNF